MSLNRPAQLANPPFCLMFAPKDKEVGDQLFDISRFKARKDCKLLYCFVYDPEGYIRIYRLGGGAQ